MTVTISHCELPLPPPVTTEPWKSLRLLMLSGRKATPITVYRALCGLLHASPVGSPHHTLPGPWTSLLLASFSSSGQGSCVPQVLCPHSPPSHPCAPKMSLCLYLVQQFTNTLVLGPRELLFTYTYQYCIRFINTVLEIKIKYLKKIVIHLKKSPLPVNAYVFIKKNNIFQNKNI